MTRPAISYDTSISTTSTWFYKDRRGNTVSSGTVPAVISRRLLQKPASTATAPKKFGSFYKPTNYAMKWGRWNASGGSRWFTNFAGQTYSYDTYTPTTASLGYDPSSLYSVPSWVWNKLEIKALNKLRNQNVNFGVLLAEAGETASMLVNTAVSISRQVRNFRKHRPRDFAKAIVTQGTANWRKTPQAWLELQYGWKPFMADINSASESLSDKIFTQTGEFVVRSGLELKESRDYSISDFYFSHLQRVAIRAQCKVKLAYHLNNLHVALLSSLGLINPLEIVWERVPYSFVVDWFLPVGNWLSALSGDFGYSFSNGHRSTYVSMEETNQGYTQTGSYFNPVGNSVTGRAGYFSRSVYSSSPVPGLYLKSPVSSGHIANALSLLASSLKR